MKQEKNKIIENMELKQNFVKKSNWLWELPKSFRKDMRVPVRVYASEKIWEQVENNALEQLVNTATLPGIVKYAIGMPDIHSGFGPPIGGVGAMRLIDGVISPGFVGFDENYGVRLLLSNCQENEIKSYLEKIADEIQRQVPSGLGKGRQTKLSIQEINKILEQGVPYLVEQGYGKKQDIENCEAKGKIDYADAQCVSERAKNRGRNQAGTLGSGNHFIDIQKVVEIFDEKIAGIFGLFKDQIVIMVHSGSRGLGHQNCTDYLKTAMQVMPKYGIKLRDKKLACMPFNSSEGQRFFKAMSAACNYAWANRQMMTYYIRRAWRAILGEKIELKLLYDVAHNIAKIEENEIEGQKMKLIVHRKGATRAFPPNHPEVPEKYRQVGQPILLPGTMGTSSFVCVGTEASKETWHSVSHGAGRIMSRNEAMRRVSGQEVANSLKSKGIIIRCQSIRGIAEEAPLAYKDVEEVVNVIHQSRLAKKSSEINTISSY